MPGGMVDAEACTHAPTKAFGGRGMTRTATRRVRRVALAVAALPLLLAALLVILVPTLSGATTYDVRDGAGGSVRADNTMVVLRTAVVGHLEPGDVVGADVGDGAIRFGEIGAIGADADGVPRWQLEGSDTWMSVDQVAGEEWYSVPGLGPVASAVSWLPGGTATALLVLGGLAVATGWLAAFRARRRRVPVVVQIRSSSPVSPAPIAPPTAPTAAAPTGEVAARLDA